MTCCTSLGSALMDVIADRYEIGQTLGAGGMARVVQAHDRLLDREVAIKLLREDIAVDPTVRERFLGEARTAARFNHPNAVTVFDTGQDGRQPWIVMELIAGQDLAQRLATSGRLEEADAVHIADSVLAALDAAHRDGMVHRDVKPGNIMLLDDGGVKLADFGIAKSIQDATANLTATGQIIGTAKYLSPEQVDGQQATPASDVYAVGCVLYEMLAGQPPFTGDTAIAIALAHTRDRVPDIRKARPDVSPAVAGAVDRALAKDPAQRFADAGEMRRALRGDAVAAAYAPTAVVGSTAATQMLANDTAARPMPRRGSNAPWGLLLLAVGLVLGGLLLASLVKDETPQAPQRQQQDEQNPAGDPEPTPAPTQPAEQTQAPAPPPASEPPAEEEPPAPPSDIPSLITLLASQPDVYGPKQQDLRKGLEKVEGSVGDKQIEEAAVLQDQTVEWVDNGELDVNVGGLAVMLLDPLASQFDGQDEEDESKGRGNGNGKSKGNDDD